MSENNQAHITIYTVIGNFDRIKETLTRHFSEMTKTVTPLEDESNGIENFGIIFHDETGIKLHINTNSTFVHEHISGMHGFFSQIKCEKTNLHQSVLNQIQVFNCIIGSTFVPNDDENRTNYIVNTMFAVAHELNGLLLTPDMFLWDGNGKLVLSVSGDSDFEKYTPIGNADFLDGGAEETPTDIARRERSIDILKERDIPYIPHLRASLMESEAVLRTPEEIAVRLLVMFGVCVYCEARIGGSSYEDAQKYLDAINNILDGTLDENLTPEEKEFLSVREPQQRYLAKFSWRYECCLVLLWALGMHPCLDFPDEICDVSAMAKVLWNQESLSGFLKASNMRSTSEILDVADLILRYDWACVEAQINGQEMPANLNSGVVQERHYALNWLIGTNENAHWDNIIINT